MAAGIRSKHSLAVLSNNISSESKLIVMTITSEIDHLGNELLPNFSSELVKFCEEFSAIIAPKNYELENLESSRAKLKTK